jgi:agmatine deiminase
MTKAKNVTVGLVQTKVSENLEENLSKTVRMIRKAAKAGAQIISLQELFRTPYFPQKRNVDVSQYCETIPGETTKAMSALAKELGVVIIVPLCEKALARTGTDTGNKKGKCFNTAVVFDTDGKMLGRYHKNHIPHDPGFYEKDYFEQGTSGYQVFKTKFAKIAVLICFDQWFPEAARLAKLNGAEIIFYPTAIGEILDYLPPEGDWHDAWETIQRSHAIANSVPVVSVNRTGVEDKTQFWGQSFVADAFGKVLKRASKLKEEVIVVKLDLTMNEFISEGWGFLRNRRPDTYNPLVSNKFTEKKGNKLKDVPHYKNVKKILEK